MRKIIFAFAFLAMASCKKQDLEKMRVVKDCTGSYLRYQGKDYRICNREKTDGYADGTWVEANFKKITSCNGTAQDDVVCYMLHPNEGWIEVQRIR